MGPNPSRYLRRQSLATALIMGLGTASAQATDTYNPENHQLSSPSVSICNATYSDMVVTIGSVNSGPSGTSATGSGDSFNPAYNLLSVPSVTLGGKDYFNVVASVSGLVSIGGVIGADTFDGKNLTIATVQVGGTVYSGTVIKVGSIVGASGGMPKGIRDLYNPESGQLFIPAVQDQVNGQVYTNVTATVAGILSIGTATTTPTCKTANSTGALNAAQVGMAAVGVQNYFASLPHTSLDADVTAAAGYMVQSGLFASAAVDTGAIGATLPDGSAFVEFADQPEEFQTVSSALPELNAARAREQSGVRSAGISPPPEWPLSAPNSHEIAFLINRGDCGVFCGPDGITQTMASAWQAAGFTAQNGFGVDFLGVTLDNILALASGHPLDFLDISTHGAALSLTQPPTNPSYFWLSDTPVTDTLNAIYVVDRQQHNLVSSAFLFNPADNTAAPNNGIFYSFTPQFLINHHVTFNPGAIIDNRACYGQHPLIRDSVQAVFQLAGAAAYMGWDNPVTAYDFTQTDAFLMDRLLGEANTTALTTGSLVVVAPSPSGLQRPFPLADILTAMGSEQRKPIPFPDGPYAVDTYLQGCNTTLQHECNTVYATNAPPINFISTPLSAVATTPVLVEFALPSIANMYVTEALSGGTLSVLGTFPSTAGTGQIVDASGAHPLTPSSWSTTAIQFPLPSGGNGASGAVTVTSTEGVPSNPAPLTEWKGQLTVTVSPVLTNMNGVEGSGGGSVAATAKLDFRADVHPVVTAIDTAPLPQNFMFAGVMGDSTMSLTSTNLSFTSSDGTKSAQWTLAQPVAILSPGYAPPGLPAGTFILAPNIPANEPASCNAGVPGPQSSGATAIFCPYGGANAAGALACSDNGAGLCKAAGVSFAGYYGYPPWVAGTNGADYDGLLVFTLNPVSYAVTFTSMPASLTVSNYFSSNVKETITLAATIQPPLYAPTATTPAVVTAPAAAP
jgi:hypothetical protein